MLRFDTTGIGESEGDHSHTNFSTRVDDLVSAARFVAEKFSLPTVMAGHSMSGTAALSAAQHVASLKLVATIGSPRDPAYTIDKFTQQGDLQYVGDNVEINVLGRKYNFKKRKKE